MATTKIRITADEQDGISVSCSYDGKKLDMTVPSNIANIAGVLAEVSCRMMKHNNEQLIKKKAKI